MNHRIFLIGLMLIAGIAEADGPSKRLITVEDHTAFQRPGSPVFSPDGLWIAYTVSTDDYGANQTRTRIWIQPADGGEAVPLTSAKYDASRPTFSLDSQSLFFVSARDGQPSQLWSVDLLSGSEARHWVALGAMLERARRPHEALDAYRQGLYLHRRGGATARAKSTAHLILALDPSDSGAWRLTRH